MKTHSIVLALMLLLCSWSLALAQTPQATLAWDAVTTNVDGSPATDLAGYRIYMALNPIPDGATGLVPVASVGPTLTQATVGIVAPVGATVYFRATAFDTSGNESAYSNEVALLVRDAIAPSIILNLRIDVYLPQ